MLELTHVTILECVLGEGAFTPAKAQSVTNTLVKYGEHAGMTPEEVAALLQSGMTVSEVTAHLFQRIMTP
jgi:hypothetical protein